MKRIKPLIGILFAITLVLIASVPASAATGTVKLSKSKITLYKGEKKTLSLKDKTKSTLVWSSSNKKIVKVTQKGIIKGVATGTATVTVKIKGATKKSSCKVTVGAYAKKLILNSAGSVILKTGDTSQIKAEVTPDDVLTDKLTYESKDASIATVDKTGKIAAVSKGITQVTVTSKAVTKKGKALSATVQICVNPKEEEGDDTASGGGGAGGAGGSGSTNTPLINTFIDGSKTTYVLNKSYTDKVTVAVSVNGQTWNRTGKVNTVLSDLSSTYTTMTNSAGTIRVSRNEGEAWWTVTDPTNGDALLFKVKAEMSYGGSSSYGQIVIEQSGDAVSVSIQ